MNRLRIVSSKHYYQRVFIFISLVVLSTGLIPFDFFRQIAFIYFTLILLFVIVLAIGCIFKKRDYFREFWLARQVEIELLRSDYIWRELNSDLQKGQSMVELPKVEILKSDKNVRIVGVRNSMKYQERLLKDDLSAVFTGWVTFDVRLNEDKSLILFTLVRQGADIAYRFDSVDEMWHFAQSQEKNRLALDKLTSAKLNAHSLVVGATGSGKSMALAYMLLYYRSLGWKIAVADPKNSDLALLGRAYRCPVAAEPDEILEMIGKIYQIMESRKKKLAGHQKFGKTALDYGMGGWLLIVDEFASLSLKLDKKQAAELSARLGNLVLEGRQLGIFVTLSMQQANAQVVPTSIREQLGNKFVMGASDQQTYVTAFGQSGVSDILSMSVKAGQGWMMTDGVVKPVFMRMPWLSQDFMSDLDFKISENIKKYAEISDQDVGLVSKGQLMP